MIAVTVKELRLVDKATNTAKFYRTFHFQNELFWVAHYGRIGASPQQKVYILSSPWECGCDYLSKVKDKRGRGYVEMQEIRGTIPNFHVNRVTNERLLDTLNLFWERNKLPGLETPDFLRPDLARVLKDLTKVMEDLE